MNNNFIFWVKMVPKNYADGREAWVDSCKEPQSSLDVSGKEKDMTPSSLVTLGGPICLMEMNAFLYRSAVVHSVFLDPPYPWKGCLCFSM